MDALLFDFFHPRCTKGNLLEFSLEPSWDGSVEKIFFCHIRPRPDQFLLDLDYSIKVKGRGQIRKSRKKGRSKGRGGGARGGKRGRGRGRNKQEEGEDFVIYKNTIRIKGDDEWMKSGAMLFR